MSYNPKSANPFDPNDPNKEWHGNNLILKDAKLRQLAGVDSLDANVAALYSQRGGSTVGAPHYIEAQAQAQRAQRAQSGGAPGPLPLRYFTGRPQDKLR